MTGINNLTDSLLQLLYTNKNLHGNIVFSPISIYLALVAYLFGAKDDTYDQLATVLTLNGVQYVGRSNLFYFRVQILKTRTVLNWKNHKGA